MGTGVTSEWIDCGYCQTRHITFCGFSADDDSGLLPGSHTNVRRLAPSRSSSRVWKSVPVYKGDDTGDEDENDDEWYEQLY